MKFMPAAVTQFAARNSHRLNQNSPRILFAVGITGVVAGTALACRATLKSGDILDEVREDIDAVKRDMSETEDYRKDLAYAYGRGMISIARVYAPAIVCTTVGVGCLTGSHVQLSRRNEALAVAYAGLERAYFEYRERVREEVGEEREREIALGIETEVTGRGEKKTETKVIDGRKVGPYARVFDNLSKNWQPDNEFNMIFLRAQTVWLNDLLNARGHVFLNEVYDALDIPRSSAGQFVGWSLHADGDNHIDLGIYDTSNSRFINGLEGGILLDFNVNGTIVDCI